MPQLEIEDEASYINRRGPPTGRPPRPLPFTASRMQRVREETLREVETARAAEAARIASLSDHAVAQRRRRFWLAVEQALILLISAAALALINLGGVYAFWGNLIGLAGQPLWFHSTWIHRQWGIFALAVVYTGLFVFGLGRWA